jgi:hypothetical protein
MHASAESRSGGWCRSGRVALTLWLAAPAALQAQVRASEPASVSQTIDGTTITVDYSRPRARGRDSLFGKVVKWDEVWTPGANWATTLTVSKDLRVEGHALAKGKYSVWMVVRPGPWTVVFDPRHRRFHTNHPDSTVEQVRFDVTPGQGEFQEVLTWSFPEVRINGATLAMQWGGLRVPLAIEVEPSYGLTVPVARSLPYVGKYDFAWTEPEPGDTTGPLTFTVSYRNGSLIGEWNPAPWPDAGPVILIPIRENWFITGFLEQGELYDVDRDMVIEFGVAAGRAGGFEVRAEGDKLIASGKRVGR